MQQAILTVDLGFGDAGKGSIVDFLTREYRAHTVVRYNGGAQAGHRVVTPAGAEHVFAQFGSGTLAGAATHLSRFMLVEPLAMRAEADHLHRLGVDAFDRTTIDARARVITPFQRATNRLKELARGGARHGSCGMGIGETVADALAHGARTLYVGDLCRPDVLTAKLTFVRAINQAKVAALRPALPDNEQVADELSVLCDDDWLAWLVEEYRQFVDQAQIVEGDFLAARLRHPGTVIFEGAQGVLLDEAYGFHPHTTWSDTTLRNADRLLAEAGYAGAVQRIGITRAYATRHGAGPFVSEDAALTHALPDAANGNGAWQQGFRVGWLDLVMLRYACEVVGALDLLAVTCLDRLAGLPKVQVCGQYRCGGQLIDRIAPPACPGDLTQQAVLTAQLQHARPRLTPLDDPAALIARIEDQIKLPVGLLSTGASARDKHWRGDACRLSVASNGRDQVPAGAFPARKSLPRARYASGTTLTCSASG
jgi:adenylosuccinate synthase